VRTFLGIVWTHPHTLDQCGTLGSARCRAKRRSLLKHLFRVLRFYVQHRFLEANLAEAVGGMPVHAKLYNISLEYPGRSLGEHCLVSQFLLRFLDGPQRLTS
jgi:hypothetical protein